MLTPRDDKVYQLEHREYSNIDEPQEKPYCRGLKRICIERNIEQLLASVPTFRN